MDKESILDQLVSRHPELSAVKDVIGEAGSAIIGCYQGGGKLLICGNGGSSSDSGHMSSELMKSFENFRPLTTEFADRIAQVSGPFSNMLINNLESALPAIPLTVNDALITAISNDTEPDLIFAQQVLGYGKEGDILFAISTSGNSRNVVLACITAKALNMKVIGLTGTKGGEMKDYCDILVKVPDSQTADVQELHLPSIHAICRIVENHFFPNPRK